MVRTVHVSRVFQVDVESQPEVVEELRRLAARGFEIFGPLDLSPCGAAAKPEPEPEPVQSAFAAVFEQICSRSGLKSSEVAALVGVTNQSVCNWRRGACKCPDARMRLLQALLERCLSSEGGHQLKAEAAGAKQAMKLVRRRQTGGKPKASAKRIASLRKEGRTYSEIAKALGVAPSTVYRHVLAAGLTGQL